MKILRMISLSIGFAGLFVSVIVLMQAPESVQALPPRPEPKETKTHIKGGFIQLTVDGATSEVWTAVQWQGNEGDWHLVDGWQGSSNAENEVKWYVAKDDLGGGPFRWLIYDAPDGNLLVTSDPFDLPEQAGETIEVGMALP